MSDTEEIDPSIAALIQETEDELPSMTKAPNIPNVPQTPQPNQTSSDFSFTKAFNEQQAASQGANASTKSKSFSGVKEVDLSIHGFAPVEKFFSETPNPVFNDPAYYKTCLGGEGEAAQRLHQILSKYLNCQDKQDRTVYRQQMVGAYWEFARSVALKVTNSRLPEAKRMAMRYGVVLPSLFSPESKEFFSRAFTKNTTGEPVMYMDEWIADITAGNMKPSTTDEVAPAKAKTPGAEQQRIQQLKSKNAGKLQSVESLLTGKENERHNLEFEIKERIDMLCEHTIVIGAEPHTEPYTEMQRKLFAEITNRFHALQKIDRELTNYLREFQEAKEVENSLNEKAGDIPEETINASKEEILGEMTTIRQMAKMTCGRQGNQFPVFTREFFHCMDKTTGFRENVLRELAWIESIDPGCFTRIHRNVPNRIVPYVLLVPTYGDSGFCWEPFDRFNRITSRGRIVIPMYPRDLRTACLTAVADLRWQVAKEKASFDWMTDGLTGHYYQYIEEKKMKGDVKQFFIDDYILWMTKEANGTQKLEKEVRGIFWRYTPFPQPLKDELKKRSLIYAELYQRDVNRSMSDGY